VPGCETAKKKLEAWYRPPMDSGGAAYGDYPFLLPYGLRALNVESAEPIEAPAES